MNKNEQAINIDFSKAWLEQTKHSPFRAADVIYKTIHEALEAKQVDVEGLKREIRQFMLKNHLAEPSIEWMVDYLASQGYITQPLKKKD